MLCKCLRQPYLVLAAAVADRGMPALRCRCYRWCCSCGGNAPRAVERRSGPWRAARAGDQGWHSAVRTSPGGMPQGGAWRCSPAGAGAAGSACLLMPAQLHCSAFKVTPLLPSFPCPPACSCWQTCPPQMTEGTGQLAAPGSSSLRRTSSFTCLGEMRSLGHKIPALVQGTSLAGSLIWCWDPAEGSTHALQPVRLPWWHSDDPRWAQRCHASSPAHNAATAPPSPPCLQVRGRVFHQPQPGAAGAGHPQAL